MTTKMIGSPDTSAPTAGRKARLKKPKPERSTGRNPPAESVPAQPVPLPAEGPHDPATPVSALLQLRVALGLNRDKFARLMGFSPRAIADWETNKQQMSEPADRMVRGLTRLHKRLAQVMSPEAIPAWLVAPNAAFEGLKPLEVVERGEIDRLWSMIFFLESGVPG